LSGNWTTGEIIMPKQHLTHGLGGSRKNSHKKCHRPHEIRLHKAASGGFVAHHIMPTGEGFPAEPEEHVLSSLDALHDHLDQHFGAGQESDERDDELEGENERDRE
jgi:hypothetical protein